jgi:hypothetical protein
MFSGDKDGNVGEGDKVLADGAELTYASDASYCLMNDIPIDNENVWNFPSDFTGSITSQVVSADKTFVDNLISNIGVLASNNDIEGIKEEVQRYVAYRTCQK